MKNTKTRQAQLCMSNQKILMLFVEPAPYILDLIAILKKNYHGQLDVAFLEKKFSQNWNISVINDCFFLPKQASLKLKWLYAIFIKRKYDILSIAGWSHPITLIIIIFGKLFHIPVIVDSDTPLFPQTSRLKRIVKKIIYPMLFKFPTLFLPAGTRQADYLKHYGVPDKKIILEKMTVDVAGIQNYTATLTDSFKNQLRENLGIQKDDCVFLFIGRLIERKGIVELLGAFSKIKNEKIKCVIAGDGPLIDQVIAATVKNPNIIYTGWLEKKDLLNLYAICEVFVLPAHYEPWGLVINEAMAAGKRVIVSNAVGCVDDLVFHQKNGLIIPPHDSQALSEAIQDFADNPQLCATMSQASLSIIQKWTLQDEAKQIFSAWYQTNASG